MEYKIVYSDRKTVALNIKDGELIVRAPRRASRRDIERIVKEYGGWIEKHLTNSIKKQRMYSSLGEENIKELKKMAKEILPKKTAYYASLMNIDYGRITITSAKGRFGSCSSMGNISYSYRLMLYPEEAIDYVVVHELAHRKEMNHSKEFYKIVATVFPDYKERAKLLK